MAKNTETTTKFKVDISELKSNLQEANRQIALTNSRFKESTAGMDDWRSSADGISAKIDQLKNVNKSYQSILSDVAARYKEVVAAEGDTSEAAETLEIKMNSLKAAIKNNESAIGRYEQQLADIDEEGKDAEKSLDKTSKAIKETGDSADNAGGKLKGFLGGLGKAAIAGIGTAVAGLTTSFLASAEATREYREDMGKLQTAYQTAGHDAETATEMYKSFYSVLGEEDRSVEAVSHLAKLTKSQEELSKWTDICAGVQGTFGDSLPIEGLTEAANETAKVGKVTGPLADALNWAGISEDEFNEKLAACNSEQERATLITNTLSGEYAAAAESYKELNGGIMDAQRAQSELTDAMAGVGAVAEPVMTTLKFMGAEILNSLLPNIEKLGQGFTDLMNGVDGAGENVGNAISGILNTLLTKIVEILPQVATIGVTIIQSLITGILGNADQILSAASEIIMTFANAIVELAPMLLTQLTTVIFQIAEHIIALAPQLLLAAIELFQGLVTALTQLDLPTMLGNLIVTLTTTLTEAVPVLLNAAITLFMAIIDALPVIITSLVEQLPIVINAITSFLISALPQIVNAAITMFMALVQALPTIINSLVTALPSVISAVINFLTTSIPVLLDAAIQLFMALVEAIPQIVAALWDAIPQIISAIIEALAPLAGKFFDKISECVDEVVKWGKNMLSTFGDKIAEILKAIGKWFSELPYNIGYWLSQTILKVVSWAGDMLQKGTKAASDFFTSIIEKVKKLPAELWTWLTNTLSKVGQFAKDIGTKAAEAAKSLWDNLVNGIKELPAKIGEIGSDIVTGLWNGINDMGGWISEKIQGFGDGVLDGIKDFFGINSPSLVMKNEVGKFLPMGLAEGIKAKTGSAVSAMKNMSEKILAPAQNIKAGLSDNGSGRSASSQSGGSVTTYNFYQTNNSPKALSRTEIYRQTKNQLAFAGGGR